MRSMNSILTVYNDMTFVRYDAKSKMIGYSTCSVEKASGLGKIILKVYSTLGLVELTRDPETKALRSNNFTIINLVLVKLGPMTEERTTLTIILIQSLSSLLAFTVRYL